MTTNTTYDAVCDAIRDVHDEASLWHLSDELVKVVTASGLSADEAMKNVADEAKRRGIPTKSANTLRLYYSVANRFTADKRVPGVSFSVHREALGATGSPDDAKQVLDTLVSRHGAAGVTVSAVKRITGKVAVAAAPKVGATAPSIAYDDIGRDLAHGAKVLITNLSAIQKGAKGWDAVRDGLNALLKEVETRRTADARKQVAKAKKSTAKQAPRRTPRPTSKPASKAPAKAASKPATKATAKAGDLRGL